MCSLGRAGALVLLLSSFSDAFHVCPGPKLSSQASRARGSSMLNQPNHAAALAKVSYEIKSSSSSSCLSAAVAALPEERSGPAIWDAALASTLGKSPFCSWHARREEVIRAAPVGAPWDSEMMRADL